MWHYEQSTGELSYNGADVCEGYSGKGEGKNNPDMQAVHDTGPIPRGCYTINEPVYTPELQFALPLTPNAENEMFGRSGFLIHGENAAHSGESSDGCIIIEPRAIRENIAASGDNQLVVS